MFKRWFSGARNLPDPDSAPLAGRRQAYLAERAAVLSSGLADVRSLLLDAENVMGDQTRSLMHSLRVLAVLERITENEHELELEDSRAILDCAQEAIQLWPDQGGFLVIKGGLLVTEGRFADGLKALTAAIERLPPASKDFVGLDAMMTFSKSEATPAPGVKYENETQEDEPFAPEHAAAAFGALKKNLCAQHPAATDRFLALIQFHRFRITERGTGLLPVLEPGSHEDQCARGSLLLDLLPDVAIGDFTRVLEQEPLHLDALVGRAYYYLKQSNEGAALADLAQAVGHHPNDVASHVLFAHTLNENGYSEDAGRVLTALIERIEASAHWDTADLSKIYLCRGRIQQDRGLHQEALPDFDRSLSLDPSYPEALRRRGVAYRDLGRFDEAIRDASAAIELDPHNAPALVSRALAFESMGDPKAARLDYQATLALDEHDQNRHAHAKARERLAALEL